MFLLIFVKETISIWTFNLYLFLHSIKFVLLCKSIQENFHIFCCFYKWFTLNQNIIYFLRWFHYQPYNNYNIQLITERLGKFLHSLKCVIVCKSLQDKLSSFLLILWMIYIQLKKLYVLWWFHYHPYHNYSIPVITKRLGEGEMRRSNYFVFTVVWIHIIIYRTVYCFHFVI